MGVGTAVSTTWVLLETTGTAILAAVLSGFVCLTTGSKAVPASMRDRFSTQLLPLKERDKEWRKSNAAFGVMARPSMEVSPCENRRQPFRDTQTISEIHF